MKTDSVITQHPNIIHADEKSITFNVETLTPPKKLLPETSKAEVLKAFSNQLEFIPNPKQQLVKNGNHPFLFGLYQAYAEHRPFVLSPDMLWLLICQAFSRTVNYNAEAFRPYLVDFDKKETLIVRNDAIQLGNPNSPWDKVISTFSEQIGEKVGQDFKNALSANFSTSTAKEKIACEITMMDTVKPFFEYLVFYIICGIPIITVEGTSEDWKKLYKKVRALSIYPKTNWIDNLLPLIQKIVDTTKGQLDIDFWINMFKIHTKEAYGAPKNFDGWIAHFFPFNKNGKRIHLKDISEVFIEDIFKELPSELVTVDFRLLKINPANSKLNKEFSMEFWAGFIGLSQDAKTMAIKPEIDWFVSHQTPVQQVDMKHQSGIHLNNITEIPDYVYQLKSINELRITFLDKIVIPKELAAIKINTLQLEGKISIWNRLKLKHQFRSIRLLINGKQSKGINFYIRRFKNYLALRRHFREGRL